MMTLSGISDGLAATATWTAGQAWLQTLFMGKIKITSPRSQESLQYAQPHGDGNSYRVEGTLRFLPKDHKIWLLRQDEITQQVRPQGFEEVQYNPEERKWFGRVSINARSGSYVRIFAVVAPSTSQEFFAYFQKNGSKTGYDALNRIPVECKNPCSVQARVP